MRMTSMGWAFTGLLSKMIKIGIKTKKIKREGIISMCKIPSGC
jgi:hypothetical protein